MAEQVRAALWRIQSRTLEGTGDNPIDGGGARETLPWGLGPNEHPSRSAPGSPPFQVAGQRPADVGGQRQSIHACTLAPDQEFSRCPVDILQAQLDDLARPQPQSGQEQQHGVISLAGGTASVAAVYQPLDLRWLQKPREPTEGPTAHGGNSARKVGRQLPRLIEMPQEAPQSAGSQLNPLWAVTGQVAQDELADILRACLKTRLRREGHA